MLKYGSPADYSEELRRIVACMIKLRQLKPGRETSWTTPVESHMRYSRYQGRRALTLTITLSPTGCEWARKGGCTMCGEFEGSLKRDDLLRRPELHIAQFASAVSNPDVWRVVAEENVPLEWLRIYQEGNYTNLHEMDGLSQQVILQLATRIKGVKKVTIEARPEYLKEESVKALASISIASGVEIEVGMGVEAQDRVVRNVLINKQGSNSTFSAATSLLSDYGISSLAYVLLKPPFLTEIEAIEEAEKTVRFAAEAGFSRISFEPMSIHAYTLIDALASLDLYSPPWLWSVVEVAKRCEDVKDIFGIGGIGYYPLPIEYCHNRCVQWGSCSDNFNRAISMWNEERDISCFDELNCECRLIWEAECEKDAPPLRERLDAQLSRVESLLEAGCYSPSEPSLNGSVSRTRKNRLLMSYVQKQEPTS